MKRVLLILTATALSVATAATNLVSNTAIVTNRVQGIVTYTMSNGVARVQDPSGKLVGTAEERALKVAAEGQVDIASAAADAAGTAMEEWRDFTATTDVKVVYIDAGFTQDLPALAPNLCGWVAGSFYDREKGEDHYYIWFNREIDYPPSMCARIVSESGTNWLDGAWKDWAVTNWVQNGREVEWRGAGKYSAEVEWIKSDGKSYFKVDFPILTNDTFHVVFTSDPSNMNKCGGVFSDARSYRFNDGFAKIVDPWSPWSLAGGYSKFIGILMQLDKKSLVHIVCSPTEIKYQVDDGELTKPAGTPGDRETIESFYLLMGAGYTPDLRAYLNELYGFSIEGKLNMIPVRFTNENGISEGAMFDKVSGKLFRNAGTGAFVIGPVTAAPVPCRELVVKRRNANCVLKTGTVITLGGKDGFDADIHKVNIEVGGEPTVTTSAQLPLFYAVTRSGTNTVTRAYTNGFLNVENGFIKEPTNE